MVWYAERPKREGLDPPRLACCDLSYGLRGVARVGYGLIRYFVWFGEPPTI